VGKLDRANIWIGHVVNSVKTGDSAELQVRPVFFYSTKMTSFWIWQLKKKKKLKLERSEKGRNVIDDNTCVGIILS